MPSAPGAPWLSTGGDARVPLNVSAATPAVVARVAWRRRDLLPGPTRGALVIACAPQHGNAQVSDVAIISRNRTHAVLAFAPSCGAGTYYLYFLLPGSTTPLPSPCGAGAKCPSGRNGGCCPPGSNSTLRGFLEGGALNGASQNFSHAARSWASLPHATAGPIESRGHFARSTEMEAVASPDEQQAMMRRAAQADATHRSVLIFPEDAAHEVRMFNDFIPLRWAERGPSAALALRAQPGEYLSFQLGLLATADVTNITVAFESSSLPAEAFRCTSCGGVSQHGERFSKALSLKAGRVMPLWLGVMLPPTAAGTITANLTVRYVAAGAVEEQAVALSASVSGPVIADHGDQDMAKRTRLRWLDSARAQDDEPAPPYTPIVVSAAPPDSPSDASTLKILGRAITVSSASCGLPQSLSAWGAEILAAGQAMSFDLEGEQWSPAAPLRFTKRSAGIVAWRASCRSQRFQLETTVSLEAEGSLDVTLGLTAKADTTLLNASLRVPYRDSDAVSKYMTGLGLLGESRSKVTPPAGLLWKWTENMPKRNSMVWVGGGTGGLRVSLKGPETHWANPMWYGWPTAASNYQSLDSIPRSWAGDDRSGGCKLAAATGGVVELTCWSDKLTLRAGQRLDFQLDLLVTPFREVNSLLKNKFGVRHYQLGYGSAQGGADVTPPATIKQQYGSTVIGLHQGTTYNPFISWIFDPDTSKNMSQYIKSAHDVGMRVKTYFTVRELSVRSALSELYAIASMGDEILYPRLAFPDPWEHSDNLGNAWLQEHLLNVANATEPGYSRAYASAMPFLPVGFESDFAVHVKGDSRWVNWYVEALHWAATKGMTSPPDNVTIDGLYLDGFNWDRVTMKRARKVLTRANPRSLIDYHCMQTFSNPYGEYGNVSVALNSMAHLPFIDNLWL